MKKYYLNVSICILCFSLIIFGNSFAGDLMPIFIIHSSPNPVGSGARAMGMGGAFIAIADDATAASWNPGGLIQLEDPEISIVGAGFHRIDRLENRPEILGYQSVSKSRVNYLSAAYPFTIWGRDMIVSASYQNLYDFTRKWDFPLIMSEKNWSEQSVVDYGASGSLSAFGISYSLQITPQFSFGFTLNFWEDGLYENEWKETTVQNGSGVDQGDDFIRKTSSFDKYTFRGFNANFGILWHVTDKLTVGAVLKTPFEADLKHEHLLDSSTQYPDLPGYDSNTFNPYEDNSTLDMPMSYGFGFAYRFSDSFTISLDIYRTEWDDFILTDSEGSETSPTTGKSVGESDIDPTNQIRIGAEYLFIKQKYEIPLCAGVFYDPAFAEGNPDDFFGFSIGSGIGIGRFKFDIAYQYRFGKNVSDSILNKWGFSQDIDEHTVYSSVIIYFY